MSNSIIHYFKSIVPSNLVLNYRDTANPRYRHNNHRENQLKIFEEINLHNIVKPGAK